MESLTVTEYRALSKKKGPAKNKYKAIPKVVNGIRFHSTFEAERYKKLLWELQVGAISDLQMQVKYDLDVNGVKIGTYIADFVYVVVSTGERVVEDAKGFRTKEYRMKKALMEAVHGISIKEVYERREKRKRLR